LIAVAGRANASYIDLPPRAPARPPFPEPLPDPLPEPLPEPFALLFALDLALAIPIAIVELVQNQQVGWTRLPLAFVVDLALRDFDLPSSSSSSSISFSPSSSSSSVSSFFSSSSLPLSLFWDDRVGVFRVLCLPRLPFVVVFSSSSLSSSLPINDRSDRLLRVDVWDFWSPFFEEFLAFDFAVSYQQCSVTLAMVSERVMDDQTTSMK
jgi:hypothetical protein